MIKQARADLKELLGREPTVAETAKFLRAMEKLPSASENQPEESEWSKVDPDLVNRAKKDLKELLGRNPTAKEV